MSILSPGPFSPGFNEYEGSGFTEALRDDLSIAEIHESLNFPIDDLHLCEPEFQCEIRNGLYSGIGGIKYPDGTSYYGNIINSLPQGVGKLSSSVFAYEGKFRNGLFHGLGTLTQGETVQAGLFVNGKLIKVCTVPPYDIRPVKNIKEIFSQIYQTTFPQGAPEKNGKPYGKVILPNGCKYEGYFSNGVPEGFGQWRAKTEKPGALSIKYSGEFKGGVYHGRGELRIEVRQSKKGMVYKGDFSNGFLHGTGKITFPNGKKYWGEVKNNLPFGTGKMRCPARKTNGKEELGHIYEGEFANGMYHGEGKTTFSNQEHVEGTYENDIHKEGKYTGINRWFEGTWKKLRLEGYGKGQFSDGRQYEGEWKNGLPHGKGVMTYPNGDSYAGDFEEDKQQGEGTVKFKDGRVYTGSCKQGVCHGNGRMSYPNGEVYEGEWADDERHGKGRLTLEGKIWDVIYDRGNLSKKTLCQQAVCADNSHPQSKDLFDILEEEMLPPPQEALNPDHIAYCNRETPLVNREEV
jgi:hypothetical protein